MVCSSRISFKVFACKRVQLPASELSIIKMLKSSLTLAKLTLVQYRCMKFEAFDRIFLYDHCPLVHVLYTELSILTTSLLSHVCKSDVVNEWIKYDVT